MKIKYFKIVFLLFLIVFIPLVAGAGSSGGGANDLSQPVFSKVCSKDAGIGGCIQQIYLFSLGLASLIAMAMIVLAGYKYMTASGNGQQVEEAKESFASALTGVVIIFVAFILLNLINPDLVRFRQIGNSIDLPPLPEVKVNNITPPPDDKKNPPPPTYDPKIACKVDLYWKDNNGSDVDSSLEIEIGTTIQLVAQFQACKNAEVVLQLFDSGNKQIDNNLARTITTDDLKVVSRNVFFVDPGVYTATLLVYKISSSGPQLVSSSKDRYEITATATDPQNVTCEVDITLDGVSTFKTNSEYNVYGNLTSCNSPGGEAVLQVLDSTGARVGNDVTRDVSTSLALTKKVKFDVVGMYDIYVLVYGIYTKGKYYVPEPARGNLNNADRHKRTITVSDQ